MSLNGTVWAPIGPSPIDQGAINANGQVTAIAINPNNPNIMYIGTAWGGVWLTATAERHLDADLRSRAFARRRRPGALAIDPVNTNVIYVGNHQPRGLAVLGAAKATQPPAGLFKSTDGGASWIQLGSGYPPGPPSNASILFSQRITVVIVDPANPQTVYLASNAGLFVSTDGGFNWKQGVAPAGDVRTLALDTTSPPGARILYAGVYGVGVVKSTDGGTELDNDPQWRDAGGRRRPRRRWNRQGRHCARAARLAAKPDRNPGALRHHGRNGNRAA